MRQNGNERMLVERDGMEVLQEEIRLKMEFHCEREKKNTKVRY